MGQIDRQPDGSKHAGNGKTTVFLSYAKEDHFFAELAKIKLSEKNIRLWTDQGQLRAGSTWRQGIEDGIAECSAVLVALSKSSVQSPYVGFEWAYGLGKGKAIIPLRLDDCIVHPRLEIVQHLDFSVQGAAPWEILIVRIQEIELEANSTTPTISSDAIASISPPRADTVKAILAYLDQKGFQVVSFDRLREQLDPNLSDDDLKKIAHDNRLTFRRVKIKGGKWGLRKIIP